MSETKEKIGLDPMEFWDDVAELLEEYRERLDMSKKELSERAGVSRSNYQDFLTPARRRRISIFQFARFCDELRIPKTVVGAFLLDWGERGSGV